jgi:hypothetical protein
VDKQSEAKNPGPAGDKKYSIDPDSCVRMKRVKPDTASVRVENRIGQQMVQIDEQSGKQYQNGL